MHQIAADVMFTQIKVKNEMNMHGERAIADMYKDYIQLDDKKFIGR